MTTDLKKKLLIVFLLSAVLICSFLLTRTNEEISNPKNTKDSSIDNHSSDKNRDDSDANLENEKENGFYDNHSSIDDEQEKIIVNLTDQSGSENVVGTDNLMVTVKNSEREFSYQWYRNDILLEETTSPTISNDKMKSFEENNNPFTPESDHTNHTIRGYEFEAEVYDNKGEKIGEDSIIIDGPIFRGKMKGVNFANFDYEKSTKEKATHSLKTLKRTNANWVSIWSLHFQNGVDGTEIFSKSEGFPNTVRENQIIHQIEKAHQLGLKVVLYPQIWMVDEEGSVSIMERPYIEGSDEWFEEYENFILHQASLAEKTGVEPFTIGIELWSTLDQEDKWLEIISKVRERYSGPIAYSPIACYDTTIRRLMKIDWFASLDYLAFSSNLETRSSEYDPSVEDLVRDYQSIEEKMEDFHNKIDKPVIFLETGMPSIDGATIGPGREGKKVPDFQEQADYHEAFFKTFADEPWVKGVFWNQWNCSQEEWYDLDPMWPKGTVFMYKPAERVLTSWYGGRSQINPFYVDDDE